MFYYPIPHRNLLVEIWELLNRVAFERFRRFGGRSSVSALLVQLVERHKRGLEKNWLPSVDSFISTRLPITLFHKHDWIEGPPKATLANAKQIAPG